MALVLVVKDLCIVPSCVGGARVLCGAVFQQLFHSRPHAKPYPRARGGPSGFWENELENVAEEVRESREEASAPGITFEEEKRFRDRLWSRRVSNRADEDGLDTAGKQGDPSGEPFIEEEDRPNAVKSGIIYW